jgi:hypothetical protein
MVFPKPRTTARAQAEATTKKLEPRPEQKAKTIRPRAGMKLSIPVWERKYIFLFISGLLLFEKSFNYEPEVRFELTAYSLRKNCSATELLRQDSIFYL